MPPEKSKERADLVRKGTCSDLEKRPSMGILCSGDGSRACPQHLRRFGMKAYCFKCKKLQEIKNPEQVTLKNGRPAVKGVCSVCGTKLFRMGKGE
jgi:hypothetical protein